MDETALKDAYLKGYMDGFDNCSKPEQYPPAPLAWLNHLQRDRVRDLTEDEINALVIWDCSDVDKRLAYTKQLPS